jgi:hypothetical protein
VVAINLINAGHIYIYTVVEYFNTHTLCGTVHYCPLYDICFMHTPIRSWIGITIVYLSMNKYITYYSESCKYITVPHYAATLHVLQNRLQCTMVPPVQL